jgi:SAM-dependent methyltransferase
MNASRPARSEGWASKLRRWARSWGAPHQGVPAPGSPANQRFRSLVSPSANQRGRTNPASIVPISISAVPVVTAGSRAAKARSSSSTALSIAREKAAGRDIDTEFVVADALHLHRLGRVFETVLDCGLLHTFDSDERRDYVASLASVTARGGHLYLLCFSDVGPGIGPHPISQEALRAAFTRGSGWSLSRSVRIESGRGSTRRVRRPGWRRSNASRSQD